MMIFRKAMQRRTFLRGAGVAMALPFLDAMVPAFAASATHPLRIGYIYLPTGRIPEAWIPATTGADYEMPATLQPLTAYRDQFLLLSNLDVKAGQGSHSGPCASYLTGIKPSKESNSVGISVDQVIAKQLASQTQLASLEIGVDSPELAFGAVDGLAGYYTSTISWRNPTTPLPMQINPRKVFERLFGDADTLDPEATRIRLAKKNSVLDHVTGRVNQLMSSVGAGDRHKLEEYLDSVRDIERSIQVAESKSAITDQKLVAELQRPAGIPPVYADHVKLMFDMMVLAYQTDMTRMITFMLGHEGSNRNYTELGAKDGHHSLTHHKGNPVSIELVKKIELHQSTLLAHFIEKMQSIKEGDGTLLDNSVIVMGGAHGDANLHLHTNIPVLVLGSAQNKIKSGRHIQYEKGTALSDLHLAVMDMAGVSPAEYLTEKTDASGILKGLDTV